MNGNPATVADQLEKELVDGQKAEMRGPLEGLRNMREGETQGGKTQGVAGVLQQMQRRGQPQGQPQGQPRSQSMGAAMGGIINAPAPNLNRMYNGGIVGYAEGGLTKDEIAAYLEKAGVKQEDFDAATSEERARVIEGINKLILSDRKSGTYDYSSREGEISKAEQGDRSRQSVENIASLFRGPATGEELMKGREKFNPNELQENAMRRMTLPDISEQDFSQQTMMPKGAMGITPGGDYSPTGKFGNTEGVDAQTGLTFAETQEALENNNKLDTFSDELTATGETKAEAAALGAKTKAAEEAKEAARIKAEEDNADPTARERLKTSTEESFNPYNSGIASVAPTTGTTTGAPPASGTSLAVNPPANGVKELSLVEKNAAVQAAQNKPLTRAEEIQNEIDALDEKEGVFDRLLNRVANTNFKKSYGGTSEAFAQGGRDLVEAGQKEKATKRKSLEGQLATETSITAADVAAKRDRDKFDITEGRLSRKLSIDDKNTVADIALRSNTAQNESLARLAKLNLDTVNSDGAQAYRMASLKLQEQGNQFKEDGNTIAMQRVVQGYVTSATSFYKGLLANANPGAETDAIKQELQAEIGRLVGMVGTNGVLELEALQRTPAGATSGSEFAVTTRTQ